MSIFYRQISLYITFFFSVFHNVYEINVILLNMFMFTIPPGLRLSDLNEWLDNQVETYLKSQHLIPMHQKNNIWQ